mmetsp:Transcript_30630/g.70569  ORF Transcript_30630/g.70569 Transcript_30630/m.70569 type:complete len:95 (-) Transcript_30630:651-935(-)
MQRNARGGDDSAVYRWLWSLGSHDIRKGSDDPSLDLLCMCVRSGTGRASLPSRRNPVGYRMRRGEAKRQDRLWEHADHWALLLALWCLHETSLY